jgi:DHA3 family macrolide efflux protein-like MFS transporter
LGVDVGAALLAVIPLLFIAVPQPPRKAGAAAQKATVRQDLSDGLRCVRCWPGLLAILFMAVLINLCLTPAGALPPLLVAEHFGGGAPQIAGMEASWGVGVIAGGLLLSAWGGFRRRVYTSALGLAGIGLSCLAIGLMPASGFTLAAAMMLLMGASNPLTNGPLNAILQSAVAPEMQGRVFSLVISAASVATPLGLIIAGPLADALGVQIWFIVGGALTLAMGVLIVFIPAVRNIEEDRRAAVVEAAPSLAD